jgi:hypothetical protein
MVDLIQQAKLKREAAQRAQQGNTAQQNQAQKPQQAEEIAVVQGEKTYYARVANSKFIFSDGQEAYFAHGKLVISEKTAPGIYRCENKNSSHWDKNGQLKWKVYQSELDEILGRNPNIYVPDDLSLEDLPKPAQNAKSESEIAAGERQMNNAGNQVRVSQEMGQANNGNGLPSDVAIGSVDMQLVEAARLSGAASSVSSV